MVPLLDFISVLGFSESLISSSANSIIHKQCKMLSCRTCLDANLNYTVQTISMTIPTCSYGPGMATTSPSPFHSNSFRHLFRKWLIRPCQTSRSPFSEEYSGLSVNINSFHHTNCCHVHTASPPVITETIRKQKALKVRLQK